MNALIYTLLNKTNEYRILDDEYLNKLYEYYLNSSIKFDFELNLDEEDFNIIFSTIYDVLRFRISDEEFQIVIEHYLKLLVADARDGSFVNNKWCINHLWYLCVGLRNNINYENYNDCIIFIQNKLIEKLNVQENLKEKVTRRIHTRFLSK